ncbi:MAG: FAD-binding protein [Rhizobiaceae bacterium]|nr:FAD-binding protein [Rhizobiaceae bacterium]
MNKSAAPVSEGEIAEIIKQAKAQLKPVEIKGGGTRDGLGCPVKTATTLSLAKLNGITLYEPGALTLVAKAGTTLKAVEKTLRAKNQRLAFEPMDHRALYGTKGEPTIGGVVACNISGSRRIQGGACRDSLIGVRFVDGNGDILKNGGRVMKNVTGLDLVKLLCGSHGTLGVITEVAFKVLPAPEREATLAIANLNTSQAIDVLSAALGSPFEITGAAHLPHNKGGALTALRVEGFDSQVEYRLSRLRKGVAAGLETRIIKGSQHDKLWRSIRDVEPFKNTSRCVWRLSVKPGDAPAIQQQISTMFDAKYVFDWGGGLIWIEIDDIENARANEIRKILSNFGGHATLVRAPAKTRLKVPVFQPAAPGIAALSSSIRKKFDPVGILNPGRMVVREPA